MPNYEEVIQQSQANIKSLSDKLKDLDKLHQDIKELIKQPEIFDTKYQQIVKLSEEYTNTLGAATKKYLDGNNTLFTTKLNELSDKTKDLQKEISRLANTNFTKLFQDLQKSFIDQTRKDLATELKKFDEKSTDLQTKIKDLQKEISRLVNTDFTKLFKDLQNSFIDQTRKDLATELKKFDEKSTDLQTKIDQLRKQVERLEKIDLEKHFDKLQKTLSEIFGAINTINITLTTIIQTLTGIVQSLGNIQTTLDTNHKEAKQLLASFSETTKRHLTAQDNQAKNNLELLESKIESLSEQNDLLKKEVKTNRIIQIVGLTIILIILIYDAIMV
jgi:ABC-type transporter Mla subunit MlaD